MDSKSITKRFITDYNKYPKLLDEITELKDIVIREINYLHKKNISKLHDNQEAAALLAVASFKNKEIINIMVTGRPQSGKTGTFFVS